METLIYLAMPIGAGALLFLLSMLLWGDQLSRAVEALLDSVEVSLAKREARRLERAPQAHALGLTAGGTGQLSLRH